MGKKANNHENKFIRCVKAPIRVLCSARDLYVRSMTQCAGRTSYATAMGCSNGPVSSLPRSFSVSSSRMDEKEDLRELIRAASQRGLIDKIEMEIRQQQQWRSSTRKSEALPRSFTVGIGKIDEDKPCEFEEPGVLYPRSRSYATSKRPGLFA